MCCLLDAGLWVGDCFIYNNSAWRLNYCVGGEVTTMFHLDRPMFLLGYLASQSRVYLIDREFGVVAYTLLLTLIEYKTLIIRGDLENAAKTLPNVPKVSRRAGICLWPSRCFCRHAMPS